MAGISLDKLTKIFPGGVRAVDGISLHLADKEFVVLVGPSGCGKSTTLRMIAGLEDVTSGTVKIGDRIVNDLPARDRDVAVVFQNYALYPHMTVYENLAFALKLRKVAKAEIDQRVRGAARILEIEHLLGRKPRHLSGGQRQRVAVGRAIVREPTAFLFDEPLSNLDAKLRVTTRAELKRLHQRLQTTTLYVTHDQEEAMTLGDRIVVMRGGVVQQADPPLVTYHQPVNRFVAGFIGMPPMNFVDGMLTREGGGLVFEESAVDPRSLKRAGRAGDEKESSEDAKIEPLSAFDLTSRPQGFRLTLPPHLWEVLGGHVGKPIVLGIRPEHLSMSAVESPASGDGGADRIRAKVTVVEPLGRDMDVYMSTSLHDQLIARVEAQSGLRADAWVDVKVDSRRVHFFEPGETGMNLSLKGGSTRTNEPAHAIA